MRLLTVVRLVLVVGREAVRKFFADNGLFLASALSFSLVLYAIPLSLMMVSVLGYTVLESERAMLAVQSVVQQFFPESQKQFADNLASIVENRGLLGFAAFVSFLVFSSTVFGSIRVLLNTVFKASRRRGFLRATAHDFVMMAVTGALLAIAVGAGALLAFLVSFGERMPWVGPVLGPGVWLLGKLLGLLIVMSLFYVLYRFAPAETLSNRGLMVSTLAGVLLFETARLAFVWYISFAQERLALYGALGGLVFFFFWLFYASAIFVLGAEVGCCYDAMRLDERRDR